MYKSEREYLFIKLLFHDLAICGAAEQKVFTLAADGTWPGFSICVVIFKWNYQVKKKYRVIIVAYFVGRSK